MKKIACLLTLLFLSCSAFSQNSSPTPREFEMKDGDTTYVMKQYYFCLLLRGDKAQSFSKEELEKIQAGHMANINKYADLGKIVVAGPFGDDTDRRGILIMDVETMEEAEAIVKEDPAVQAGRLTYEIHPWWTAKGTVFR
jgi:uncharacterized protein YciI